MSIRFKLMLAMNALVILCVYFFGFILYNYEKRIIVNQIALSRENVLNSLAKVTVESILSDNEEMLINYTLDLKHIINEIEVAYVLLGDTIIAHTDKELAPRPLPLSYYDKKARNMSGNLLVRKKFKKKDMKNISFSRKTISINNHVYDIAVGYSDIKIQNYIESSLNSILVRICKAGMLVILLATLMSFFLADRMIIPLNKLVKAFISAGKGNLDYRIQESKRRDEIGIINKEFNSMMVKLKELDQMKKDFVSSVTHELKSPIGAIESYLDLMAYEISKIKDNNSLPNFTRFSENISFIKQNTQRLLNFISDLLDVAKIERGKFEITRKLADINSIIKDCVKLFAERAKLSGIELIFENGKGGIPQIYIDEERILQVLINLVSNAIKFTPSGGKVIIKVFSVAAAEDKLSQGQYIRVLVKDTGRGIPQEELNKIFEKFHQVPGSRKNVLGPKGTGLGLFIVKNIVEAHGGKVFVESSEKGSTFGFDLPV